MKAAYIVKPGPPESIVLPPRLVVRSSCGSPQPRWAQTPRRAGPGKRFAIAGCGKREGREPRRGAGVRAHMGERGPQRRTLHIPHRHRTDTTDQPTAEPAVTAR